MNWVLIIMLVGWSSDGGVSTTSVEFRTKESCEVAAKAVEDTVIRNLNKHIETICVAR